MRQVRSASPMPPPDTSILYIAARAPRPGFTKSRLGRTIGDERAAALYAAFVRDLAGRLTAAPFVVGWYVTPDDAWTELAPLLPTTMPSLRLPGPILPQPDGDWTQRQRALFASAATRHEQRIVLIASDSPQLELGVLTEAFARLADDDLVLGPTLDGGYYLIGMRTDGTGRSPRPWDVLAGVQMSTGTVTEEIQRRATQMGLHTSLLPATFDIDEAADLEQLLPLALTRTDLAATRAALLDLDLCAVPIKPASASDLAAFLPGAV